MDASRYVAQVAHEYSLPTGPCVRSRQPAARIRFSIWHTFKHHIPRFIITILIDVIAPLLIYVLLQKRIKPVYALLAASSPPLIMVIVKALWLWVFDALGFLIFFTFAIAAVVAIVTRNAFVLLLEKSLVTCILSIMFGLTLVPFRCSRYRWRPLAYYFYQDLVPTRRADIGLPDSLFSNEHVQTGDRYSKLKEELLTTETLSSRQEVAQVYEWLYANCRSFRLSCYSITSIWSIGFLLEFLARVTLILIFRSVSEVVIYGHIALSTITVIMLLSTGISITIERRYTLAFIERWRLAHDTAEPSSPHRSSSDFSMASVGFNADSNCILTVHA